MMSERDMKNIPAEMFEFTRRDEKIHDEKIQTKAIGYFMDAWLRFRKNKSAVVAFTLIVILVLFAIIVPFVSHYDVNFREGYYGTMLPRNSLLAPLGIWDGGKKSVENQEGYEYLLSIGEETGRPVIMKEYDSYTDSVGLTYHTVRVDSYQRVGYAYLNLTETEYNALQAYQDETGTQVIYPLPATHATSFLLGNGGANFWYKLKNEANTTTGGAVLDEAGNFIPNYLTSDNPDKANYKSLKIATDNGGADGNTWFVYAQKNQSGYKVRVDYYEYFRYVNGQYPSFIFGTNAYGQDIFTCLAAGARLSFLLAITISLRRHRGLLRRRGGHGAGARVRRAGRRALPGGGHPVPAASG